MHLCVFSRKIKCFFVEFIGVLLDVADAKGLHEFGKPNEVHWAH